VIEIEQLSSLFSIVLQLDGEGRIVRASDTFQRHMPDYEAGVPLFSLLDIVRPATANGWDEALEHLDSLFLLTANTGDFAIRGQLLPTPPSEDYSYIFCGSPWLSWISDHAPGTRLGMDDFAAQDSQLDQLFLMTTEKRMVSDLEKLNSALKQAKRETELAQEARAALFARMSHEMRTPLNGVISALSLLSDAKMSEEAREVLRLAESSSNNLLHVINYVLDMSKIESGGNAVEQVMFNLRELLESVTDIVRTAANEKDLDLRWEAAPDLAEVFIGDKPKLRQCLINLVSNAIKFTEKGSVTLRVMPSPRDKEGQKLRFEVEDTGIGISQEHRKRIFEPFWTGAASGEKGTGLGLDIVRRAVEMMGGVVGVVSAPGAGSVFWLDIPLTEAETEAEAQSGQKPAGIESAAAASPSHCYSGRVLLVDDNQTNLILGRKILETMGVTVEVAQSGEEALSLCWKRHYDLVFMDISMPGMDGVHTTIRIRERFDGEQLPVVALTAYASTEEERRCLAVGMNHYLIKPIVREQLAEQLQRFLGRGNAVGGGVEKASETDAGGLLNADTLDTLIEQIGAEGVEAVIEQFRREAPLREARFQQAMSEGDVAAAQREAHTLGSTCLSLGLDRAGLDFRAAEASLLDEGEAGLAHIDAQRCGELLQRSLQQLEARLQSVAA
jgi:signal transduction histidine kinase/DNA-binding response OmpR family regulator